MIFHKSLILILSRQIAANLGHWLVQLDHFEIALIFDQPKEYEQKINLLKKEIGVGHPTNPKETIISPLLQNFYNMLPDYITISEN